MDLLPNGPGTIPSFAFLLIVCSLTIIADENPGYFLSDNHVQDDGFSANVGFNSWVVKMKYNDIFKLPSTEFSTQEMFDKRKLSP